MLDGRTIGFMMVCLALLGTVAGVLWQRRAGRKRRERRLAMGLSEAQQRQLEVLWPLYGRLPMDLRGRLDGWAAVFMAEVNFEACGDLTEIREDMRLLVAGQACLLLAGGEGREFFPRLRSVLIYPRGYLASGHGDDGWTEGASEARAGESWQYGSVVLGWEEVKEGARGRDGSNLVLHEFAHQLDFDDGSGDGAPLLTGVDARRWKVVFSAAWEEFNGKLERGERSVLDPYGATNPAEFFAVAVETFFESGRALRHEFEDLYGVLADWFGCDPAGW